MPSSNCEPASEGANRLETGIHDVRMINADLCFVCASDTRCAELLYRILNERDCKGKKQIYIYIYIYMYIYIHIYIYIYI